MTDKERELLAALARVVAIDANARTMDDANKALEQAGEQAREAIAAYWEARQ